jgi:hypothetical protein
LSEWNPVSVRYYKWGYSWLEIKDLYIAKNKDFVEKKQIDYQFLIDLAKAALGGGGKDETFGLDTGEGIEEMTPEQEAAMREALGEDFSRIYGYE